MRALQSPVSGVALDSERELIIMNPTESPGLHTRNEIFLSLFKTN